jgi:glutaredoxin
MGTRNQQAERSGMSLPEGVAEDRLVCGLAAIGESLFDAAGLAARAGVDPDTARSWLGTVAEQNWVREIFPGRYVVTSFGRLRADRSGRLFLLGRAGCHLCEQARQVLAPLARAAGLELTEVDIDADRTLRGLYDQAVPVVFANGRELARGPLSHQRARQVVRRAKKSSRRGVILLNWCRRFFLQGPSRFRG